MTGRYVKRSVEVEAVQWDGTAEGATPIIDWIIGAGGTATYQCSDPERCAKHDGDCPHSIAINTLEGTVTASLRDWIIRGVAGEFYPCKPDIFEATYEPAPAPLQEDGGEGHRVELQFDGDAAVWGKLIHPEHGCKPPVDEESGEEIEGEDCWITGWFDEHQTDLLHGKITLAVTEEWDGDSARLHVDDHQFAASTQPAPPSEEGPDCERCSHIAAEALAMAEQLEDQPLKRRFRSVEEIKREFFPALFAEEQKAAREAAPPSELAASHPAGGRFGNCERCGKALNDPTCPACQPASPSPVEGGDWPKEITAFRPSSDCEPDFTLTADPPDMLAGVDYETRRYVPASSQPALDVEGLRSKLLGGEAVEELARARWDRGWIDPDGEVDWDGAKRLGIAEVDVQLSVAREDLNAVLVVALKDFAPAPDVEGKTTADLQESDSDSGGDGR